MPALASQVSDLCSAVAPISPTRLCAPDAESTAMSVLGTLEPPPTAVVERSVNDRPCCCSSEGEQPDKTIAVAASAARTTVNVRYVDIPSTSGTETYLTMAVLGGRRRTFANGSKCGTAAIRSGCSR